MSKETRAIVGNLLCVVALLPLWPLYGIRAGELLLADFMDWLVHDRRWTISFLNLVSKIEHRFQTDAMLDEEYQAWKKRMKLRRPSPRGGE